MEIKDIITGSSSFACINPKQMAGAVRKNETLIFFTGNLGTDSGLHFDLYNTNTRQWSMGLLPFKINDATIISVNNTIYVAGGRDSPWGPYFNGVWKLEF